MTESSSLTLVELHDRVKRALRQWHSAPNEPSPLASLLIFHQLRHSEPLSEHEATNRVLYQALQLLEERHPQDAQLLRRSDLDNELNDFVANIFNMSMATFYRQKNVASEHLAEVLLELEQEARTTYRTRLLARLAPPSNTQLLGTEQHRNHLAQLLTSPEAPYIVALAGMGGIGKTTLADAVMRDLIAAGAVQEIGWVTARLDLLQWHGLLQQLPTPALTLEALAEDLYSQLAEEQITPDPSAPRNVVRLLRGLLKERPHLIVIDNLETIQDIESLVSALRDLAAPSKFLLTTRESLFTQPDIYHYAVPELSPSDAMKLIRQEAQGRNLTHLQQASDADLQPIVEMAGGNPLALRLIVGQTYIHPLSVVLENLTHARGTQIEHLYTYIYRHAWERLDETTRRIFLAMPLVSTAGADLALLAEICELAPEQVVQSLEALVRLNLVDVRGDLHARRYTIHNLTRTFLHEQVLRWQ